MITAETMSAAEFNDADLVAESLQGNREAFRQIVERYQNLISSLGYCATGNVTLSEDLAQETFVTAWKRLAELREPAKLRAWLCGIHRFLVSKEYRRLDKEPAHAAETLESVEEWTSPEPLPRDHVISDEEKAILWRSLERIPEVYREPLVLFYREHQSIQAVAKSLDLSEDAVRQRLSRGRKLLHRQVLGFVEAALEHTKPDKAFALGVLAALPLVTTTAKAAVAGVAIKGGSTVKAATSLAMLAAVLTGGVLFLFSLLGFFAFTGACVGCMMSRACKRSARDLQHVVSCWRLLAVSFLGIAAPAWLASELISTPAFYHTYFAGTTWFLRLLYPVVLVALVIWIGRWWHGLRHEDAEKGSFDKPLKGRFATWMALGLLVPALICGYFLYSMLFQQTWNSQNLSAAQAQQTLSSRKDAEVWIEEDASGTKMLRIRLPESRRQVAYFTTADDATLAVLKQSGDAYKTMVEGQDFIETGLTWHGLIFLSIFITSMGGVVLAGRPWEQRLFVRRESDVNRDARAAKNAFKTLAVSVAAVMLAGGFMLALITRWSVHRVSAAEVPKIVADQKYGEYEIYQFSNGTKELWICQPAHLGHPDFIAPASAATLALLADKGIAYKTYIQGRDFGYDFMPRPWMSVLGVCLLGGGAIVILWSVSPKFIAVPVALVLIGLCVLIGFYTPWRAATLSAAAARTMIVAHPNARFEIREYSNGSRELWVTPHGKRHYLGIIAPADDSTLALLAGNKINYKTLLQGRDFGYGVPTRGVALLWISGLTAVAGLVLWLAWRKRATGFATGAAMPN